MQSKYPLIIMYDTTKLKPDKLVQLYNKIKTDSGVDVLLIPDSMSVLNSMPKDQLIFLRDKIDDMIKQI